jgi:hypothetical protein
MRNLTRASVILTTLFVAAVALAAQQGRGAPAQPPDITGKWTGVWNSFNPAEPGATQKEQCPSLSATVESGANGVWTASFEGDCGRPYKYTIKMEGHASGPAVLFKGSADLGPRDGGVFDWIGRADGKAFIGFYTSGYSTGTFTLSRAK